MSEKSKINFFLIFLALIFIVPISFFAWNSYQNSDRVSSLLERVRELAQQDTAEPGVPLLITGLVVAPPGQTGFKSIESQSDCVASAAWVVLESGRSHDSGEVIVQEFPVASNQVEGLEFKSGNQTYTFELINCELSLWQRASKPNGSHNYIDGKLPAYLGSEVVRAHGDNRKFTVDEYLLKEGDEVTFLGELDQNGNLTSGEFPLTIVPGSREQFVQAVQDSSQDLSAESQEGILILVFVIVFLAVFVFMVAISRKFAAQGRSMESSQPSGWLRVLILILVLGVMAIGAFLPGYLDSL